MCDDDKLAVEMAMQMARDTTTRIYEEATRLLQEAGINVKLEIVHEPEFYRIKYDHTTVTKDEIKRINDLLHQALLNTASYEPNIGRLN